MGLNVTIVFWNLVQIQIDAVIKMWFYNSSVGPWQRYSMCATENNYSYSIVFSFILGALFHLSFSPKILSALNTLIQISSTPAWNFQSSDALLLYKFPVLPSVCLLELRLLLCTHQSSVLRFLLLLFTFCEINEKQLLCQVHSEQWNHHIKPKLWRGKIRAGGPGAPFRKINKWKIKMDITLTFEYIKISLNRFL